MPSAAAQASAATRRQRAEHADFLIVGAGVSGIDAAHHMRERFPGRSLLILEGHDGPGGTWWTHRYPGVRSDSDLFTYGYQFKPWRGPAIASGPAILSYLDEVIAQDGLAGYIRYQHRVTAASWSTAQRQWTVQVTRGDDGEQLELTAGFLWMCAGYYNHDKPYRPAWPKMADFQGQLVHPQRWPADLDLAGKRVIVIGSGATAATLIPAIAGDAEHVTMLQRSPSYFLAPPGDAELAATLGEQEPAFEQLREAHIAQQDLLVQTAFADPAALHALFIDSMRPQLPEGFDIGKHFTPRYRPWQQRIGVVPEGDFFATLRSGKASIVTDTIDSFTPAGVKVSSGQEIPAGVIVTATGFTMSLFGDVSFTVDGSPVDFTKRFTWRGLMISGVPNMAYVFGYLRYSWTLRADMVVTLVAGMLERMAAAGQAMVVPALRAEDEGMPALPFCDPENFSAGYIMRAQQMLFRQGDRDPWTHMHEYFQERDTLPAADLDDGSLRFS